MLVVIDGGDIGLFLQQSGDHVLTVIIHLMQFVEGGWEGTRNYRRTTTMTDLGLMGGEVGVRWVCSSDLPFQWWEIVEAVRGSVSSGLAGWIGKEKNRVSPSLSLTMLPPSPSPAG
jgi:hypothetical protein